MALVRDCAYIILRRRGRRGLGMRRERGRWRFRQSRGRRLHAMWLMDTFVRNYSNIIFLWMRGITHRHHTARVGGMCQLKSMAQLLQTSRHLV